MNDKTLRRINGLVGLALFATFTVGLAHSIATGFAGFLGGLPVILIVLLVLAMALYDYWEDCWRTKD